MDGKLKQTNNAFHHLLPIMMSRRPVDNVGNKGNILWLRSYTVYMKVEGSIPYEVIGIFNCSSPSSRTLALASTQTL
jgi:hypothetical protein